MDNLLEVVKSLAFTNIETLSYQVMETPLATLRTIDFQIVPDIHVSQEEYAKHNLSLDKQSCLGKVAQAAAVVEKHFPEAKLEAGEVLKDYLAGIMLNMLKENKEKRLDPSFMHELLMYEEPHLVLLIDGQQFEPLSLYFGQGITHPKVEVLPLWEAVASSVAISKAWPIPEPQKKLKALHLAKQLCEGLTLTDENMCVALELLGREKEALALVKKCYNKRPNARSLYVLHLMTNETQYYNTLVEKYTTEVVKYF